MASTWKGGGKGRKTMSKAKRTIMDMWKSIQAESDAHFSHNTRHYAALKLSQ